MAMEQARLFAVWDPVLGDGGKGTLTDFLCASHGAAALRFGSGPNAGHRVVTPDGRAHIFNQVPSGAFVPGVGLGITGGMLIDPFRLCDEIDALRTKGVLDLADRLRVSPSARLVLPHHIVLNRLSEVATGRKKGSTGRGNGQAVRDTLSADPEDVAHLIELGDLYRPDRLRKKLDHWCGRKREEAEALRSRCQISDICDYDVPGVFDAELVHRSLMHAASELERVVSPDADTMGAEHIRAGGAVVLEGAQGFCLDRQHGTRPNVTPYDTTIDAVESGTSFQRNDIDTAYLVTRAYGTRHGPGLFPSEISAGQGTDAAVLIDRQAGVIDSEWHLRFRVGWLDMPMLRHAVSLLPDLHKSELVVTCIDKLSWLPDIARCEAYLCPDTAFAVQLRAAGIPFEPCAQGLRISQFHPLLSEVEALREQLVPQLSLHPGWAGKYRMVRGAERYVDLPGSVRRFVESVATDVGLPLTCVSVGPSRDHKLAVPQ